MRAITVQVSQRKKSVQARVEGEQHLRDKCGGYALLMGVVRELGICRI